MSQTVSQIETFATNAEYRMTLANRPPEYERDMGRCITRMTADRVYFDPGSDCYRTVREKYKRYSGPLDARVWGPPLWALFHAQLHRGRSYFLAAFVESIPCGDCTGHFRQILADNLPPAENAADGEWRRYGWTLHNLVNLNTGKPEFPYGWESEAA